MSSSSKKTQTQSTTQTTGPEQWMRDEGQDLYNTAKDGMPDAFKPYDGERVADYGTDYNTAKTMVEGIDPNSPTLGKFKDVLDQLYGQDSAYLKGTTQDHMNPYTSAVLDPTIRNLNEQRGDQLLRDNAEATSAGAFGDPQAGIAKSLSNDRFNTQISDATNRAYSDAWDKAQNQDNLVAARLASTGQGYGALDQAQFNRTSQLAKFLTQFGLGDQQLGQAKDDVAYNNDLMAKGGYQQQRVSFLNQLLNATPHNTTMNGSSNTTTTEPDNSGLQLLGKIGGTILGGIMGGPQGAMAGAGIGGSLFGGGSSSGGGGNGQITPAWSGSGTGGFAGGGGTGQFEYPSYGFNPVGYVGV
jgi:hypothetical protein